MKILILAPLERKTTKNVTSARPRLVFELAKGLIERGHKVTVIGTKDSKIKGAKIIPVINKGFYELYNMNDAPTGLMYAWSSFLMKQAKLAEDLSKDFDVIHSHVKPEFIPFLAKLKCHDNNSSSTHQTSFR